MVAASRLSGYNNINNNNNMNEMNTNFLPQQQNQHINNPHPRANTHFNSNNPNGPNGQFYNVCPTPYPTNHTNHTNHTNTTNHSTLPNQTNFNSINTSHQQKRLYQNKRPSNTFFKK